MNQLPQFVIDRYNSGQDKWQLINDVVSNVVKLIIVPKDAPEILWHKQPFILYDFLFNPKWGFAKAFCHYIKSWEIDLIGQYPPWTHIFVIENDFKRRMAIAPDVIKYLEQFNDKS